jgi:PAS domain S-box-containing protein
MKRKLKIIYIEDSAYDAEIVTRALRKSDLDFSLELVTNAEEFRNALETADPDVVLSDHSLLQFNSTEALAIYKSFGKNIPFILVTGTMSEEFAVSMLKDGVDDYILKDKLTRLPTAIIQALKTREAVEAQEELLRNLHTLFKNINEVFFSVDMISHRIIQISDACKTVLGHSPEEFKSDIQLWRKVIHQDDPVPLFDEILKKGEVVESVSRTVVNDGETRWIETKIIPTLSNGQLTRIDGVISDITAQKNVTLQLEEKCLELNGLIYRITHDIRGPVVSMQGLVDLALRDTKDETSEMYLTKIKEAATRLDKIILGLSQITAINVIRLPDTVIDFETLIDEVLADLEYLPGRKNITINKNISISSGFYSNEALLKSVIQNLVHNAIIYHRDISASHINISAIEKDGKIIIGISDNGIGIPETSQSKVFDMFYRATQREKGSGLGLYIVKNAVDKLGGTIALTSRVGEGTNIVIQLPARKTLGTSLP